MSDAQDARSRGDAQSHRANARTERTAVPSTAPTGNVPPGTTAAHDAVAGRPVTWPTQTAPSGRAVRRLVRRRATIRRVDPWSVLKLSLIFYVVMLAVVMLVLTMLWAIVNRVGLLDTVLSFLTELRLEVQINGGNVARAALLIGLLNVVLWSGVNVFIAFLYNLVADLVGGLKVTLAEEE